MTMVNYSTTLDRYVVTMIIIMCVAPKAAYAYVCILIQADVAWL